VFDGFDWGNAGKGSHLRGQWLGTEGLAQVAVELGDPAASAKGICAKKQKLFGF
jgi:hypothetical protein